MPKSSHRDGHTKATDRGQHVGDLPPVLDDRRLGQLEFQPPSGQPTLGQRLREVRQQERRAELYGRDVDADVEVARQLRCLPAGFLQNPGADRQDLTVLFRKRNELGGETIPSVGWVQRINAS